MSIRELFELKGKCALVTGAATGLGRAESIALAEMGADVACADVNESENLATAQLVRDLGRRAHVIRADVTSEADVQRMVQETVAELGAIDILVNNAGIAGPIKPAHEYEAQEWNAVISVDLTGVFLCAKEAIKAMLIRGKGGKIINLVSTWGLNSSGMLYPCAAYCAAKAGVVNLTRQLGAEYAKQGIHVNAMAPGFVETEVAGGVMHVEEVQKDLSRIIPFGRHAQPQELSGLVVFLASKASDYITGTTVVFDGGLSAYTGVKFYE